MEIKPLKSEMKLKFGEIGKTGELDLRKVDSNIIIQILEEKIQEIKTIK
jgi:hypothetical protein